MLKRLHRIITENAEQTIAAAIFAATLILSFSISIFSRQSINDLMSATDYDLAIVRVSGLVEPRMVRSITADLKDITDVKTHKALFFRIMLPIIAGENERIRALRAEIQKGSAETHAAIKKQYGLHNADTASLLARVDIIPPSMALAQAAIESGWGTSRFARQGNSFFGQRVFGSKKGIRPKSGAGGFRVQIFDSIALSVRSYMHNLNTHGAYKGFRRERASQRRKGAPLNGLALIRHLGAYSEIGGKYGEILHRVMQKNRLIDFDKARLKYPILATH